MNVKRDGGDKDRTQKSARTSRWNRIVLALAPDVIALLVTQGEVSLDALDTFRRWSLDANPTDAQRVRDLERAADEARVKVVSALRIALATPIDQEDLYVLSERCDHVVNAVKNVVSEAEAMAWTPDTAAGEMAVALHAGMAELLDGFRNLTAAPARAGEAADRAVGHARDIEHLYRQALGKVAKTEDVRTLFTSREFYRSYGRAAETLVGVADRLWYAVLSGS